MKKAIVAMLVGLAATSYGVVNVNWTAAGGFFWSPSDAALLGDGTGNSTRAQLMYSADNVQDATFHTNGINLLGEGVLEDKIWASLVITEDSLTGTGDEWASFPATQNFQTNFVSGWVYAIIFQDNALAKDDYYYYTPMIALADITGATPPQFIQMNTDTSLGDSINAGPTVGQVVPEPATVMLFGIGGMGAWMLRRSKMKSKEEADA